jgi:benzoyl-CoA-dihydrodiol lyase
VRAPTGAEPSDPEGFLCSGASAWAIAAWRELDDAVLHLRLNEPEIGLVLVTTSGDGKAVLAVDHALSEHRHHWLVHEIVLLQKRVLKRMDLTARTFYAMIEPGSAFVGSLFELALAADRSYMLATSEGAPPTIELSPMNAGLLPMSTGLSRLQARFLGEEGCGRAARAETWGRASSRGGARHLRTRRHRLGRRSQARRRGTSGDEPHDADGYGSQPEFAGPETMETKIFGRLSAWQNWIFTRPNSTGEKGR